MSTQKADGSLLFETKVDEKGFDSGVKKLGGIAAKGMAAVGASIVAAGTTVAGLGAAAIKVGIEFESAFAGVKKTVDASDEQLSALHDGLIDLSKEIPVTAAGLSAIAESAGQLGIDVDNIEEFTATMADLSVATNLTAEEAATSFARFANIVGMSQENFDKLGSVVVALGNNLATTEAEITAMAMRIAGAGSQVGLTEAQIMAFSGALSSVGIEAEAGGTAFSTLISKMSLAVAQGGAALTDFSDVAGMTGDEFREAFEQDAGQAILSFIQGLARINDEGGSAIKTLDDIGLSDIRMRDALLRASGASDVFAEALDIANTAWDENIALSKEAEQRYKTMESRLQLLKNSVAALGIAIYESTDEGLGSAVDLAMGWVDELTQAFSSGGTRGLVLAAGDILADMVSVLAEKSGDLIDVGADAIDAFATGLRRNAKNIATNLQKALKDAVSGLSKALPSIAKAGVRLATELVGAIAESLPDLLPAAVDVFFDTLVALLTDLPTLIKVGAQFAVGLVEGIFSAIPRLLSGVGDVFTALFTDNFRIADAVAEQTADMRAAFENIQDEIAQANEAFADQQESILASAEVAEQYAGIIDRLSGKDLNAEEMAQLQAAVEGLNALYPDLNLQIDEQGRLIGIAKDEIHEYIQASTQMALTEAYLQKIKDNTAALVDVQIAQREAVEEYDAALAQKNELEARQAELLQLQTDLENGRASALMANTAAYIEAIPALESYFVQLEDGTWALQEHVSLDQAFSAAQTGLLNVLGEVSNSIEVQTGAMDTASGTIGGLQGKINGLNEENARLAQMANESGAAIANAGAQASGAAQSMGSASASLGQYSEAASGAANAVAEGMNNAAGAASTLPTVANMAAQSAVTGIQNATAPMAEAGQMMMQSAVDGATSAAPELATAAGNAVDAAASKAKGQTAQCSTIGSQMVQGMVNGVNSNSGALATAMANCVSAGIEAARRAANINSPSRRTRDEVGKPLAEGEEVGYVKQIEKSGRRMLAAQEDAVFDRLKKSAADTSTQGLTPIQAAPVPAPVPTVIQRAGDTIIIEKPCESPAETARQIELAKKELADD